MAKINQLYVAKRYGNYADPCLMLGLAILIKTVFTLISIKTRITLKDEGFRYCLQFNPIETEAIADSFTYTDLFPLVKGAKTKISESIPEEEVKIFNTVEETEHRKRYRDYLYQGGKKQELGDDSPDPPDPRTQNGVILTSMRHDRNHNGLWETAWTFKEDYGVLAACIFEAFSDSNPKKLPSEKVAELFKKRTQKKLPTSESAVKIFMPTSVQGVNRIKADSNKTDPQKADWLELWLIAAGLFHFGLSERVKVADSTYDWRVLVLNPQEITLDRYQSVLDDLRRLNPPGGGHGIARFDAELDLKLCQQLLNHHPAITNSTVTSKRRRFRSIQENVSGFSGTHFASKGQVYGVKEVFSLGLPKWMKDPENSEEIKQYQQCLSEHLAVVQSLTENETEILATYRDFITGSELELFFPFQILYADYIIKQLANSKYVAFFSIRGLNLMTRYYQNKDPDFLLSEITENEGFKHIAQAINSATVYAGKNEKGWERIYGLAQKLGNQTASKKDFIAEIMAFLASYENENLRIDEDLRKQGRSRRIWTTKNDLDQLIDLIDKFGSNLVGNLLIAYGYAQGWWEETKKAKEAKENQSTDENTDSQQGE